jgi:transposase
MLLKPTFADSRLATRLNRSKPLVEAMRLWFEEQPPLAVGRSTTSDPLSTPALDALTRFLHEGRIELDTNPFERAIRPVELNARVISSSQRYGGHREAILCSLIEICKLNEVEPCAYLLTCSRA